MQLASPIHPLGEMTFNPAARRGDPEWRVMYVGVGDTGSGEQRDIRRFNPQRLDNFNGKILRIVPDLRAHTATSTVSENGRYRIPNDNPFVAVDGARKEIWALGLRNPHRLVWDVDPARRAAPRLIAFNIGLTQWETVVIVEKGANYGYPLREGTQAMTPQGMTPVPADDTIPLQITDTVTRGTVKPTYPVIAYPHTAQRRRRHRRRLRLSRHADSGVEGQAALRRHHHRTHLVRGDGRRPARPTTATRRRSRRCTSSTPAFAASSKRRSAHAAAKARRCLATPPSRAAAASTSASRRTTPASSTC